MTRIPMAVLLGALCFPLSADERLVAVDGAGEIELRPDLIRISMILENKDKKSSARAKAYVDELASKVAAALLAGGVREADFFSSSMNIYTDEYYDDDSNDKWVEYIASRDVDVIVRDIESYSSVVQALVDAGVSEITDVEADVSDYRAVQMKALALAVRDARAKAEFLAGELGAALGQVHQIGKQRTYRNFTELEEVVVTSRPGYSRDAKTLPYEFQPGPVSVRATVYVEFIIE